MTLFAGKLWGNPSHQPLLAVHGKQDNCGVYDRLIPQLKGKFYIFAIDLPGHGFSSQFPPGLPIHFLNYVISFVNVLEYLKWSKLYLLGHSLGGQLGLFFTAIFPQYVEKLIILDHVAPDYVHEDDVVDNLRRELSLFLKINARVRDGKAPVYTYQQALNKLTNRDNSLTTEAAKIVAQRSLIAAENGYMFCMDQRIKHNPFPSLTTGVMLDVMKHVACPVAFIFSSFRYDLYGQIYHECMELVKEKPNAFIKLVTGNHDVHQNHPERVVPLIDEFFFNERSKL